MIGRNCGVYTEDDLLFDLDGDDGGIVGDSSCALDAPVNSYKPSRATSQQPSMSRSVFNTCCSLKHVLGCNISRKYCVGRCGMSFVYSTQSDIPKYCADALPLLAISLLQQIRKNVCCGKYINVIDKV